MVKVLQGNAEIVQVVVSQRGDHLEVNLMTMGMIQVSEPHVVVDINQMLQVNHYLNILLNRMAVERMVTICNNSNNRIVAI